MAPPEIAGLSPRDRHLFGPGPKRMLSLDGGGVRGAIAIGFLERLESLIEEIEGRRTLLCDWFDFIGGTSTGAIIAAALALGYRAAEVRKFYHALGPRVFRRSFWRIEGLMSKFDRRNLISELKGILGDRTLDSDDLRTGLVSWPNVWILGAAGSSPITQDPNIGTHLPIVHLLVIGIIG
jgi:predicted acylesterase/phospholipase RssA